MRNHWRLAILALAGACAIASCATGSPPSDDDDDDDDDSGDGGGGASSSSSSSAGQGGAGQGGGAGGEVTGGGGAGGSHVAMCGNGVVDPGEACDGADFGAKTCQSLGLGGGFLQCNGSCKIVASKCTPAEICTDSQDNDQDFLTDCLDDDCSSAPVCLDSCAAPPTLFPGYQSGDSSGRPNSTKASCSPSSGPEIIYELVAPETGDMTFTLNPGGDMSLSIRTLCADATTELACVNAGGAFQQETLTIAVTQGMTYYVVLDGTGPNEYGFYDLFAAPPEGDCLNLADDDNDSLSDCEDPSNCKGSPTCAPGPAATGAPCSLPNECTAGQGDPICISENFSGWPAGYCSEFCDLGQDDCGPGSICVDYFGWPSGAGTCFHKCVVQADCRAGYFCADFGLVSTFCIF